MADEALLKRSVPPYEKYFKYVGDGSLTEGQLVSTVWTGDVVVGEVVKVTDQMRAKILAEHSDWESSSAYQYNAQTTANEGEE